MTILKTNKLAGPGGSNAIDGSVFFNGGNDSLAIPSIALGSGDWTIEFWFYSTKEGSQDGHIYDGRGTGSAGSAYPIIQLLTTKKISFYTAGATRITTSTTIQVGSWNHVALVKNSGSTKAYINGVNEGQTYSDSTTYIAPSNGIGRIGSDDNGTGYYFYGYLSNYRILKGTALYTADFTPPTEKLKVIDDTVLLCCQDSDDPTQEATGKTITAYGNLDYSLRDYNLITNGNFDSSSVTGWTLASGSRALGTGQSGTFGDGNHLVLTSGTVTQAFTTVIGRTYFVNAQSNGADSSYISTSTSTGDAIITDIRSSPQTGSGVRGQKSFVATQTTYYVILVGGGGGGNFDTVSVYEAEPPKAPKVVPPVGTDAGTVLEGGVTFDSLNYMTLPRGTTAQRANSRGRAIIPGGYNPSVPAADRNINAIQYIEINTTANALDFGDLSFGSASGASCGSSTRGITGGSYVAPGVAGSINNMSYYTIASTGNGITFGELTQGRSYLASFSSSTRGIWAGGVGSPTPSPYRSHRIDYVTIATTGNAQEFGDTADNAYYGAQGASSPTRGIWAGGLPSEDMIQYVTIASTGDAKEFGNLSSNRKAPGEASSSTRCVIVGGYTPTALNSMEYITIATTGNAKDFGDLTFAGAYVAGTSNGVRAVWCGRYTVPGTTNTIEYTEIQTLGNAQDFGDLVSAYGNLSGATSDTHGGLTQ